MRASGPLSALLLLLSASAIAEPLRVEVILFRQPGEPIVSPRLAPDSWDRHAVPQGARPEPTRLDDVTQRLGATPGYRVLLHQAWLIDDDAQGAPVPFSLGERRLGHHPLEGVMTLKPGRRIAFETQIWLNRLGPYGEVLSSETLLANRPITPGRLTFIDHQSLGLLVRLSRP